MTNKTAAPSWTEIAKAIKAKSAEEVETKVAPAVHKGLDQVGTFLVRLGQKLQQQ